MSREGYWRSRARRAIEQALREARADRLEGNELVAYVREAYPFGTRDCYPYKVWLEEFRLLVHGRRKKFPKFGRNRNDAPGQGQLFEFGFGVDAGQEGGGA